MHDVLRVAVADGYDYLMHNFGGISFLEVLALHNHFKELATAQNFCHYVNFFIILVGFKNLEYIRMIEALEYLNFGEDAILLLLAHAHFVHYFYGALGLGPEMAALSDLSVGSGAENVAHCILLMDVFVVV